MAGDVKIQIGDEGYRIRCGDDFSEFTDLGVPIEWKAPNGKLYLAYCDTPEGVEESNEIETQFDHYVYEARPVATEDGDVEEVEGEGDGDSIETDED